MLRAALRDEHAAASLGPDERPTYVEARAQTRRTNDDRSGSSAKDRIAFALRLTTARKATSDETKISNPSSTNNSPSTRAIPRSRKTV